jgi:hypothetical protein
MEDSPRPRVDGQRDRHRIGRGALRLVASCARNDTAAFARVVLALSEDGCVSRASSATKRARSGVGAMPNDCAIAVVPPGTGTSSETPPDAAR